MLLEHVRNAIPYIHRYRYINKHEQNMRIHAYAVYNMYHTKYNTIQHNITLHNKALHNKMNHITERERLTDVSASMDTKHTAPFTWNTADTYAPTNKHRAYTCHTPAVHHTAYKKKDHRHYY